MGSPVSPEADPEMRFKCKGFIPELAPEETSMEPGKPSGGELSQVRVHLKPRSFRGNTGA